MLPDWLRIDQRLTPSAHVVLVRTSRPVLVDAGFLSSASVARLGEFLAAEGVAPADLEVLALTHFHADHVGGAGWLQRQGVPVALHEADATLVEIDHPDAFDRRLLGQRVPDLSIDRTLRDGDVIDAGERHLEVVHVPGQTPGHVAFWEPRDRVLISGDMLQGEDVAWVRFAPPWDEGALEATVRAIDRLAALEPAIVVPGHGPVVTDVQAAVARTRARYAQWREDPDRIVGHAARRVLVTTVALRPSSEDDLLTSPWAPAIGEQRLLATLAALERSGVVVRDAAGLLHTTVPHEPRDG